MIANLLKAFYWTQNMYIIVFLYPCMLSVFAMRMSFGPRQPQPAPMKGRSPELPLHCRLQLFFHARQLSLAGSRQAACYYLREAKQRHLPASAQFLQTACASREPTSSTSSASSDASPKLSQIRAKKKKKKISAHLATSYKLQLLVAERAPNGGGAANTLIWTS